MLYESNITYTNNSDICINIYDPMFVAKFSQVSSSDAFTEDKNGNLPYIGEVLAGKAKGTLINGTMFKREGLLINKLYACENVMEEYENPTTGEKTMQVRVQVLDNISALDYPDYRTKLGAGVLDRSEDEEPNKQPAEVKVEA